jgi:hypothetical protein
MGRCRPQCCLSWGAMRSSTRNDGLDEETAMSKKQESRESYFSFYLLYSVVLFQARIIHEFVPLVVEIGDDPLTRR